MRCPFATWRGTIPNETPGGMIAHRGLVLHVQQSSSEAGTDSWFHDPAAQASAHFGVAFDGSLDQWVDTDDKAWAEAAGNPYWVSVEIEGFSGTAATDAQVNTIAKLYKWLQSLYKFPFQSTDDPNGTGLGWHGMGGQAWGGHLSCPGDPIKAQRPKILSLAIGTNPIPTPAPTPSSTGETMFTSVDLKNNTFILVDLAGAVYTFNANGTPGGHYLGGLNNHPEYNAGEGKPEGAVVGIHHYDDGDAALSAYVIVTRDLAGHFHNYNFPSNGSLAK